jgi:hypothetical protein
MNYSRAQSLLITISQGEQLKSILKKFIFETPPSVITTTQIWSTYKIWLRADDLAFKNRASYI